MKNDGHKASLGVQVGAASVVRMGPRLLREKAAQTDVDHPSGARKLIGALGPVRPRRVNAASSEAQAGLGG